MNKPNGIDTIVPTIIPIRGANDFVDDFRVCRAMMDEINAFLTQSVDEKIDYQKTVEELLELAKKAE